MNGEPQHDTDPMGHEHSRQAGSPATLAGGPAPPLDNPDQSTVFAAVAPLAGDTPCDPIATDENTLLRAGRRLGPYVIQELLGSGGQGSVYRALRIEPYHQEVAIKVLKEGLDEGSWQRFQTERQVLAALEHPHIARLLDGGATDDGRPFLVMELVRGRPLNRHCDHNQLNTRQRVVLLRAVCLAVHYAHERQVIHRDLKPDNVLVAADDTPKVTDFGLAKRLQDEGPAPASAGQTQTGAVMGTPSYMAPEQAWGKSHLRTIGVPADVYALGAILYELLTGRPPFRGDTVLDTLQQLVSEDPVSPSRISPRVPRDLETICLKCLHKEPSRRYASARKLADDLGRYLDGQPIVARPTPILERAAKWVKRRPAAAALLGVSSAAIAILLVAGLLFTNQIREERDNALAHETEAKRQEALAKKQEGLAESRRIKAVQEGNRAESQRVLAEKRKGEADKERKRANLEKSKAEIQLDQTRRTLFTSQLLHVAAVCGRDPDLGRLLLHDTRACPLDLRDFSWRYYSRLCRRERTTFKGHGGVVHAVAISPDGKLLASGGRDNTIRIWDLANGKTLAVLPQDAMVLLLGFAHDGRTLVSYTGANTVQLWNVATKKEIAVLRNLDRPLAFTPDGRAFAGREKSGKVNVYDASTGQPLVSFAGPAGDFRSMALTSDRKVLALGTGEYGRSGTVKLWDVAAGKQRAALTGHHDYVTSLAFTRDGKTLASSGGLPIPYTEGEVKLWDVATGQPGVSLGGRTAGSVTGVAFSADGKTLAAGSLGIPLSEGQGEIKLWEVLTGVERLAVKGYANIIWGVAFAPDAQTLASANADGTVKLWDVSARQERATFEGHTQWVRCLACSRDGKILASGSSDRTIGLWDLATRTKRATFAGHEHRVLGVCFSPDGKTLFSASRDRTLKLWDVPRAKLSRSHPFPSALTCVACSPDGQTLAIGAESGSIYLWSVPESKIRKTWKGHAERLQSLVFSPDGRSLASGSGGGSLTSARLGQVKLWDVNNATERFQLEGLPGKVYSVAFSPKGLLLAAGGGNIMKQGQPGEARVWDAHTGRETAHIRGHTSIIYALTFTTGGKSLVTGSFDNTDNIKIWDIATGQERATLAGHGNGIQCLAAAPDGNTLISGSGDLTLKVWEAVPESEK